MGLGATVVPGEPKAREGDPYATVQDWIPFPSASLRPGMTVVRFPSPRSAGDHGAALVVAGCG